MTSGQPRACLEAGATRGCVPRCLQGISPNLRNLPLEGERPEDHLFQVALGG